MSARERTPQRISEAADERQLRLARKQGEAYSSVLGEMTSVARSGVHSKRVGDYDVGVAIDEAVGMWMWREDELVWSDPNAWNCHVEVTVRDAADGRFVPALQVTVTLIDPAGDEVGTHEHPFAWHPWLYHYGRNWDVPVSGEYTVRVRVGTAPFPRHDYENGRRFAEAVEVDFDDVHIVRGRKRPAPLDN